MNKDIKDLGNKQFGWDPVAQGKGMWKEVTSSGKLGKTAKKEIQQKLHGKITAPRGVIFDGNKAIVGKEHGKPILLDDELLEKIKEFAQLHVEQALQAAAENAEITYTTEKTWDFTFVDKQSILNAYPKENIK